MPLYLLPNANRPMFCSAIFTSLENWSIPTDISRGRTYTNAESFYLDLLAVHDNHLLYQGNAAVHEIDACSQAKDLVLMKALIHQFTNRHVLMKSRAEKNMNSSRRAMIDLLKYSNNRRIHTCCYIAKEDSTLGAAHVKTASKDGHYWYLTRDGISLFWRPEMTLFVKSKLDEYAQYLEEVQVNMTRS
ncbi:hypothetical protein CIRG_08739 [Coccidioides immitis RMSCC 2394]|uniref:Uncharacterized protein n=1 Tax=Coccidioides immitis RMSCC 2394 TaxID=404692 RepID=A0A0J6YQ38_COCIT|nr:hypothetical protein CIRG_08739 [Coccidioides immitis RMSCC 2394]